MIALIVATVESWYGFCTQICRGMNCRRNMCRPLSVLMVLFKEGSTSATEAYPRRIGVAKSNLDIGFFSLCTSLTVSQRLVSRVTGQVPYQDFTFPITAFTRTQRDFCHNFRVADNPGVIGGRLLIAEYSHLGFQRLFAFDPSGVIMKINWSLTSQPMECPGCAAKNPDAASQCGTCHTPFPVSSSQETLNEAGAPGDWSVEVTSQQGVARADEALVQ